ncbi:hypothetical protein DXM26_20545 [Agrobacterium tumefaciens]|uniref:putative phage abortive infection protein n=1 Tax=Agrobacterium tumefaciens TaxID=358 RepID=UPI00122FD91D|nr:hypothetical protein DXM26_20545 [Agrobacterium tumefaciens]
MIRVLLAVLLSIIVVAAGWLAWGIYSVQIAHWALGSIFIPAQAGPWGDSFGPFSAFFSALGFTAVLITLWVQQNQIRETLRAQHRQQFENTFFQLLTMIRENREHVRFRHSVMYTASLYGTNKASQRETFTGHTAFRAAFNEMTFWVKHEIASKAALGKKDLAKIFADRVHARYESTLGAHHRLVYNTLDRIRIDPYLSDREKNDFANLVRSQFTSFEAIILGCNGLNRYAKDFDDIIVRFRLLKYARTGIIYNELKRHYPESAFRGRTE